MVLFWPVRPVIDTLGGRTLPMNALSGTLIGSPSLGKAVALSIAFHAGLLAAMAGWTFHRMVDRAMLAGTPSVVAVELTLAEEPEETPTFELATFSKPVLIAPDYVEMPDQRFEDVPTAQVMEVDLTDEMLDRLPAKQVRPAASSPPPRDRARPRPKPATSNSEVRTPPSFKNNRPPRYPDIAIQRRWEGTVLLRLEIGEDGRVGNVEVSRSSGHPVLDAAAVRAVRTWRGEPARRGGRPVGTVEVLPILFQLPTRAR